MSEELFNEDFDRRLREAMRARPEPAPPPDLAARAMRLAEQQPMMPDTYRALLTRHQRVWRLASTVAAMIILAILVVGGRKLVTNIRLASETSSQTSQVSDSSTSTDSSTSSDTQSQAILWIGGGLLAILAALGIGRALATDPRPLDYEPAGLFA